MLNLKYFNAILSFFVVNILIAPQTIWAIRDLGPYDPSDAEKRTIQSPYGYFAMPYAYSRKLPKSSLCLLALKMAVPNSDERVASLAETTNTLSAFRNHNLRIHDAQPGAPEGYMSSQINLSYPREQVARRIVGIEKFRLSNTERKNGFLNFIKTRVIVGEAKISDFIWEYIKNYSALAELQPKPLFNDDFFPGQTYFTDLLFNRGRSVKKDKIIAPALDDMHEMLKARKPGVALLSLNADIYYVIMDMMSTNLENSSDSDGSRFEAREGSLQQAVDFQNYLEAPTVVEILRMPFYPGARRARGEGTAWLGVDFYLELRSGSEPELHIIARGSEKRPSSPSDSPRKQIELPRSTEVNALQPALIPVR